MKTYAYILSHDAKWHEKEFDITFIPQIGSDLDGLVEQPLRINGLSYHIKEDILKLRMSWLSMDALTSVELEKFDWKLK
jgi:hypothetical protein